jgi:hypothetical protein
MALTKAERSLRLLGRKTLELDRVTGSNGEIFYDTDTGSLRIYSSNGVSAVVATRAWVTANSPQSDWNQATSTAADFIKNKPAIPTNTNQLTNGAGFITSTGIPSQTGNSGKYLTTNGTAVSWATVTATVTASDVGLGNVTNESKATMFASPTFTGTVNLSTATASTSTTTGALTVAGGAGIAGNLVVGGIVGAGGAPSVITGTLKTGNYLDVQGFLQLKSQSGGGNIDFKPSNSNYRTANIEGALTAGTTPQLIFSVASSISSSIVTTTVEMYSSETQSTSSTTGALVVTGGVGISKNLYVGGSILSRINSRITTAASASTLTPDISVSDIYAYTALAAGLTVNAPIGTPVDGNKLMFRLLDNGTARALTWNATYTIIGVTLPTTTVINKTTYVGCIYNANNTRWDVIAVSTQA